MYMARTDMGIRVTGLPEIFGHFVGQRHVFHCGNHSWHSGIVKSHFIDAIELTPHMGSFGYFAP